MLFPNCSDILDNLSVPFIPWNPLPCSRQDGLLWCLESSCHLGLLLVVILGLVFVPLVLEPCWSLLDTYWLSYVEVQRCAGASGVGPVFHLS